VLQPVLATDVLLLNDGNPTYHYFALDKGIAHNAINLSAGERFKCAMHIQNAGGYHEHLNNRLVAFAALRPAT
jgi:hypothetical protein